MILVKSILMSFEFLDESCMRVVEPIVRLRATGVYTDHDVLRTKGGETLRNGRAAIGASASDLC